MGLGDERGRGGGGGGIDANLQVMVWQDKFYPKKFCVACSGCLGFSERGDGISYKGDNSTLAPTFPVLSVGLLSSDIRVYDLLLGESFGWC